MREEEPDVNRARGAGQAQARERPSACFQRGRYRRAMQSRALLLLVATCGLPAAAGGDAAPAGPHPWVATIPEALPGAVPFPADLRQRLLDSLLGEPTGYRPRTAHLDPRGGPLYSNRLLLEASPYLRQHAHNPVDWFPWGDEAFERARALERPVLLSIGYSTCHWCHVMEEESFDDPETAAQLNRDFVAIKVDREVRPDIDSVYMTAAQALGQGGGWPLNVWLTADREPFYAGTYFPPEEGRGRPAFRTVLTELARAHREERGRLTSLAKRVRASVQQSLEGTQAAASAAVDPGPLAVAMARYAAGFDPNEGGMRRRTKFPSSLPIRFLLREHRRTGAARPLDMARLTLDRMARGGIHDQLGGGFHRYTTEPRWLVPHFEKMLYDNALLLLAYTEAWQLTGSESDREVVEGLVRYLARDMTADSGALFSATDADSQAPSGEMEEGRFFTWTPEEIRAVLTPDLARAAIHWFGVTEAGQLDGRSILHTWRSRNEVAAELGVTEEQLSSSIVRASELLLAARAGRTPPLRDDKVLVGWNGLAISGLARAGLALEKPEWLERAARAARGVLAGSWRGGELSRVADSPAGRTPAMLEDAAFLIAALLDLFEIEGDPVWLQTALDVQGWQDARFADEIGGAYYGTASGAERLLAREKPARDGAIPSGNSVAAMNLLRLHALTTEPRWLERAGFLFASFAADLERDPIALPELLLALDFHLEPTREIAIVLPSTETSAIPLLAPLRRHFLPNRVLTVAHEGAELEARAAHVPWLARKRALRGRATAYVCIDQVCDAPTDRVEELARQLTQVLHAESPGN